MFFDVLDVPWMYELRSFPAADGSVCTPAFWLPRERIWFAAEEETAPSWWGRFTAACLPAGALAYGAARAAEGAGDMAAAGAGTLTLLLVVVVLARPFGIGEITGMVTAAGRARLRR
ncbi:hypothetical protein [Streptomyces sp. NPDC088789]|uniref:hypothetical protein n=1 Tax=Streptomyces sp. NPDC088789 TaxID=3365899 RepID=UPI0037F23954